MHGWVLVVAPEEIAPQVPAPKCQGIHHAEHLFLHCWAVVVDIETLQTSLCVIFSSSNFDFAACGPSAMLGPTQEVSISGTCAGGAPFVPENWLAVPEALSNPKFRSNYSGIRSLT
jgi:hypothetical protein